MKEKEDAMPNQTSPAERQVGVLRWVARFVSIPWALCALAIVWFVAGTGHEEGMPLALYVLIVFIAFLLTVGAAIMAGVWGKEALGGKVLLVDGGLILLCSIVAPQLPGLFTALFVPPLLAGVLFLECDRRSRSAEAPIRRSGPTG
jgi:hypothetical protein